MSEENIEIASASLTDSKKRKFESTELVQSSKSSEMEDEKAALLATVEELTKQNEQLRADNESQRCELTTKLEKNKILEYLVRAKSEQLADKKEQLDSVRAELNKLRSTSADEKKRLVEELRSQKLQRDEDAAKLEDLEVKIVELGKLKDAEIDKDHLIRVSKSTL